MKILDKYIAKNFLIGYFIAFAVLVGLRIIIDLFVNIDEFTESSNHTTIDVFRNILVFYGVQSTIYFRDFAGIITVVAAVFSMSKMTRANELVAVMASGVSLKRVIMPIIVMALLLSGLLVIDQEILIPRFANIIVRKHDEVHQSKTYSIECLIDSAGSIIYAGNYDEETETMTHPSIILRQAGEEGIWQTTGWITADKAVFNKQTGNWDFETQTTLPDGSTEITGGRLQRLTRDIDDASLLTKRQTVLSYKSSLTPEVIPIRRQEQFTSLLSTKQLREVASAGYVRNRARLYMEKHSRFTDPLINFIMLLVALPILVCRDNKAMKPAIMVSFLTTGACFIAVFVCKMFATEAVFGFIRPDIWVFVPVIVFLPIAVLEIDAMKT